MKKFSLLFIFLVANAFGQLQPISKNSVRWYGAAGNGADATAAFQRAVNTGLPVYVPAGSYLISSPIVASFHSNKFEIFGEAGSIVNVNNGGTFLVITNVGNDYTTVNNSNFYTASIHDLVIKGEAPGLLGTGIDCYAFDGGPDALRLIMDRVSIYSFNNYGVKAKYLQESTISDCFIAAGNQLTAVGFLVDGSQSFPGFSSLVRFYHNLVRDNRYGYEINNGLTISDSDVFEVNGIGIYAPNKISPWLSSLFVRNGYFEGNIEAGACLMDYSEMTNHTELQLRDYKPFMSPTNHYTTGWIEAITQWDGYGWGYDLLAADPTILSQQMGAIVNTFEGKPFKHLHHANIAVTNGYYFIDSQGQDYSIIRNSGGQAGAAIQYDEIANGTSVDRFTRKFWIDYTNSMWQPRLATSITVANAANPTLEVISREIMYHDLTNTTFWAGKVKIKYDGAMDTVSSIQIKNGSELTVSGTNDSIGMTLRADSGGLNKMFMLGTSTSNVPDFYLQKWDGTSATTLLSLPSKGANAGKLLTSGGYRSTDGSDGITQTSSWIDNVGATWTIVIKNGLVTSLTSSP